MAAFRRIPAGPGDRWGG